ncbi:MAG: hypothetical protein ABIK09_03180 [Pseudomonadota bacterium]
MRPCWTPEEGRLLDGLDGPGEVQSRLDAMASSVEPVYRCPRSVMRALSIVPPKHATGRVDHFATVGETTTEASLASQ